MLDCVNLHVQIYHTALVYMFIMNTTDYSKLFLPYINEVHVPMQVPLHD